MVSIYAPYQRHWSRERRAQGDFRASSPRFQDENLDRNLALVDAIKTIADAKGVTVAQIAIARVLSRGDDIVALVGARRPDRLAEPLGARYAEAQRAHLDSERR